MGLSWFQREPFFPVSQESSLMTPPTKASAFREARKAREPGPRASRVRIFDPGLRPVMIFLPGLPPFLASNRVPLPGENLGAADISRRRR